MKNLVYFGKFLEAKFFKTFRRVSQDKISLQRIRAAFECFNQFCLKKF